MVSREPAENRRLRLCRACVPLILLVALIAGAPALFAACGGKEEAGASADVVVGTSHLAEIASSIAGGRLTVRGLIPAGVDPHSFEPTPNVAQLIAESRVVIVDVFGLVPVLDELIQTSATSGQKVVEAAAGLTPRRLSSGAHQHEGGIDPHFWLDPVNVMGYVDTIAKAFVSVDPGGRETFTAGAEAYTEKLRELDAWIREQVALIPPERRLLVTDHESFGYFADRYGFKVVGTVLGAGSSGGSPSAQELAALVQAVKQAGVPAIFVETGSNPELAQQVAREAGVTVVTDLYTHSVGEDVPTYLDMMRSNVTRIVEALR